MWRWLPDTDSIGWVVFSVLLSWFQLGFTIYMLAYITHGIFVMLGVVHPYLWRCLLSVFCFQATMMYWAVNTVADSQKSCKFRRY